MAAPEGVDREQIQQLLRGLGDVERFVAHLLDDRKSWDEWLRSYTEYKGKLDRALEDLAYIENLVCRGTPAERPLRDRVAALEANHARHLDDCGHRQDENDNEHSRLDGELRRVEGACTATGRRLDKELSGLDAAHRSAATQAIKTELEDFKTRRKTARERVWELAIYILCAAIGVAIDRLFGVALHATHP